MYRCVRTIHDDMVRCATGMNSHHLDDKDWASLTREFEASVGFWFNAHAIASSKVDAEDVLGDVSRSHKSQRDSVELENGHQRLKRLLGIERLSLPESVCVRKAISRLVGEATKHDDVDEAIWAISVYLRLEEGQRVSEIHRTLADRNCTPDVGDGFLADYGWNARGSDWRDYESWFEDPFLEGDYGDGPPSSECRRQVWWERSEEIFAEPDEFRLHRDCPDLANSSFGNAALALKPVFSAVGRENRYGLNLAVWSLLDFATARSKLAIPDDGPVSCDGDRSGDDEALPSELQPSKAEKAA
jgi:hypothetical protein